MADITSMATLPAWRLEVNMAKSDKRRKREIKHASKIEEALLQIVSAAPLMQFAFDNMMKNPSSSTASDSLAYAVHDVVQWGYELEALDSKAGEKLLRACQIMQRRSGTLMQHSLDMGDWDDLGHDIAKVTRRANEWDIANGTSYGSDCDGIINHISQPNRPFDYCYVRNHAGLKAAIKRAAA
jgi:hypothetical protein